MILGSDKYVVRLKWENAPEGCSEELLERKLVLSEQNQYRQTLGRRHGREERVNNGFFESPCVSSKHGELFVRDGQVWYKDTRSRNKSRVNGVVLQAEEPVALPQNSSLVLADTKKNVALTVSHEASPVQVVDIDVDDDEEDEELIYHLTQRAHNTGSSSVEDLDDDEEDTLHNSQSSSFFSNVAQSSSIDSPLNSNNVATATNTATSCCPLEEDEDDDDDNRGEEHEEEDDDEEEEDYDDEEEEEEEEEVVADTLFESKPGEREAKVEEHERPKPSIPQPTLEFAPEESEPEPEAPGDDGVVEVLDSLATKAETPSRSEPQGAVITVKEEVATTTSHLGKRKREEDDEPFESEPTTAKTDEQTHEATAARPSKVRQLFHDAIMITTGVVLGGAGTIAALLYTE
jgi:pSer/pThr/pTyr-binding forkhead associated (FHA) protein